MSPDRPAPTTVEGLWERVSTQLREITRRLDGSDEQWQKLRDDFERYRLTAHDRAVEMISELGVLTLTPEQHTYMLDKIAQEMAARLVERQQRNAELERANFWNTTRGKWAIRAAVAGAGASLLLGLGGLALQFYIAFFGVSHPVIPREPSPTAISSPRIRP